MKFKCTFVTCVTCFINHHSFRFELAISDTNLSLMERNDIVRDYQVDMEGVPETAIVMKRLSVDEYIQNLTNALAEAKDEGFCHGRILSSPSAMQKCLMAEVMNAGGYCSTKWIGHCRTKEQKSSKRYGWKKMGIHWMKPSRKSKRV